ncbi:MAG: hypothetical protein A2Y33_02655 [Spirochaetes bacterium GWF1_51_8]|nr:MAG: hypothetical protein A2Y33_02655 [Spirochaetes bacterium GWF1_51_8]
MKCGAVMAVRLEKRVKEAVKVQEALTKFGCNIAARFGIHDTGEQCSDEGLILLCLNGSPAEIAELAKTLKSIPGVKADILELK